MQSTIAKLSQSIEIKVKTINRHNEEMQAVHTQLEKACQVAGIKEMEWKQREAELFQNSEQIAQHYSQLLVERDRELDDVKKEHEFISRGWRSQIRDLEIGNARMKETLQGQGQGSAPNPRQEGNMTPTGSENEMASWNGIGSGKGVGAMSGAGAVVIGPNGLKPLHWPPTGSQTQRRIVSTPQTARASTSMPAKIYAPSPSDVALAMVGLTSASSATATNESPTRYSESLWLSHVFSGVHWIYIASSIEIWIDHSL